MAEKRKFLVYGGKTGWIGQQLVKLLQEKGENVVVADARIENREDVVKEITTVAPTNIILCAGLTGRPNVDWCEEHKEETTRVNVIGVLNVCDVAFLQGNIHVAYFGTGCIYEYDKEHTIENNIGFKEEEIPNFRGSFYSKTKIIVEELLKPYNNILILRIRMPLSDDLHPRNFITKITKYEKVVDVPNSMTVLYDLLPISLDMSFNKVVGTFNFTNPGSISHNQILSLYKQYVDPSFSWSNFSLEEQAKILKAGRSNNLLDTSKLEHLYPTIRPISQVIHELFQRMAKNVNKNK